MNTAALRSKQKNMRRILDYVIKNGDVSRIGIANAFNISTATVTNLVTEMIGRNLLYESRQEYAAAGRKTTLLRFNADLCRVVSITLPTDRNVEIAICNLMGDPVVSTSYNIPIIITEDRPEVIVLRDLINFIKRFIESQPQDIHDSIRGVGICVGGMVNAKQTIDSPKVNWRNINLSAPLQAELHLPVYVEGVTRIKALFEMRYIEPSEQNVIYLNLSTGIGIVNFFGGKMIEGCTGIAGEAGHISLNLHGPKCYCGNRGCFELYCGMEQILVRAAGLCTENNKNDVFYDLIVNRGEQLTAETLFKARAMGSLVIHELFNQVSEYLGAGLANLCNIFDPDRIIVSAYLDNGDSFVLDNAMAEAKSRIVNRFSRDLKVTRAHLRIDNMHLAICAFVLKQLLDEMFS